MKRYSSYKQHTAGWIESLPEHWAAVPVKYVCTYNDNVLPESIASDTLIKYVEISDVDQVNGLKGSESMAFQDAPSRARRLVRDGDIIISTVRTYLRAVAPIKSPPDNLVVSTGFAVIRPDGLAPSFARYALVADGFVGSVIARSTGVSYPAINASDLVRIPVPVPPIDEQITIAAYLDTETKRIDGLIEEKKKLKDLLIELRKSTISEAVTKGLDSTAPIKDSGVAWLGKIPEHWLVLPIKGLAKDDDSLFTDGDWIESKDISDNGVRYITTGNIGEGKYKEQGFGFISEATFNDLKCTEVLPGDILVSRLNHPIGRACIVPDLGSRIVTSVDNVIFRPAAEFLPSFVIYRFSSADYFHELGLIASGATMQRISRTLLGNVRVAWPPFQEQLAISGYLDTETKRLDDLISHVDSEIELLKELRASTITDAVLGRIDVRKTDTH